MSTNNNVEEELRVATNCKKQKADEDRQVFLTRLMVYVQSLSDDDWERLSYDAQKWSTDAAKAYQANQPMPEFPTPDVPVNADIKQTKSSSISSAKSIEPKSKSKVKEKTKKVDVVKDSKKKATKHSKQEEKSTKKKSPSPPKREIGCKIRIKELLIEDPQFTVDDIYDTLTSEGIQTTVNTVQSIRAEFRHSLKFLKSKGLIKLEVH